MKLPSRDFRLAGGLVCRAREIERNVWLEHVAKHPLGIGAIARSRGRDEWNLEGWDRLVPPVVSEPQRVALVKAIGSLSEGRQRCEVPEIRGKKSGSDPEKFACRKCTAPIVGRCENLVGADGVGVRYAAVIESLLGDLEASNAVVIAPSKFHQKVQKLWGTPGKLEGITVLTVGLDDRSAALPIARISRHDGVRAEFYLEEPDQLGWRTTYRDFSLTRTGPQIINFLTRMPRPAPRLGPVSDLCVVPRRWWEAHGN